jgi:lipopolysaccharide export system protein LptA
MINKVKKVSTAKKVLIGLLIVIVISGVSLQIFITRYLPSLVKERLSDIIVKGSDSLYKFEVGKFDLGFWGGTIGITDLRITIDSTRYKKMNEEKKLPPLTFEVILPKAKVEGINIKAIIFSKRINVRQISFTSAEVKLARHFKTTETANIEDIPLWKLIQPQIRSITVNNIICADLKINYKNVDSAAGFHWQFDKSNILFSDIQVDSTSASDSNRLLFAKNIILAAADIKMKTPDGLYNLQAKEVLYTSAARSMEVKQFDFTPAISNQEFIRHFGYQHEIYRLKSPSIHLKNFQLPEWINHNKLLADTVELASPSVVIYLDRHAKPYPYSKKGKYPHQLLQQAPFTINVKRVKATGASITYNETNNLNNLTGKFVLPSLSGIIDNITNDPVAIAKSSECIADIRGTLMKTGKLHTVFRFNLADKNGAFRVNATITNIDAEQVQPLFVAMTSVEIQSFNMKRLDYSITGNENSGTGTLSMQYDNMDILLNKVEADKSLNKKGFFSFLANRLVIYKENPMEDNEERKAVNVVMPRDATRSFFNLVWKTMFSSAGEIVLRPLAQRKIEKRKQRQLEGGAK